MKKISDILNATSINLERQFVKEKNCERCGKKRNVYRMPLIGGPKKGQWMTLTEPCDCTLSRQAVASVQKKRPQYYWSQSTINDALKDATLENFLPENDTQSHAVKKAAEFIKKVVHHQQARMILYGEPGVGKSHLAVAIGKVLANRFNKACLFIEATALKQMVRSTWSRESKLTESELMRLIFEADLVILDDAGSEGMTSWTRELLFSLLNARLSKSLLVTTNMTISEIEQAYGTKIMDRLLENMSKQDLLLMEADYSHRLKHLIEDAPLK
ncbi:AAA domain-containing protein [Terrilactibacillus sp. BCM23-1]|uniref:AAA domain-containing protein n=1 Tax=Terrilactibacillus tamarindi TaxID=2599694 RepID=A0A6N8CMV5_9BACI|nr:ATP-binding protein [Terrilactibacillus tamarindi]MTT31382.1 AAA domain-containing protein [Terrilactibacillus tamarindi]